MFFGRIEELASLHERYNSDQFEFVCIYGRRRVGKTELITEFVKDKKAVFFTGLQDTHEANLTSFSIAIFEGLNIGSGAMFSSFEDAFKFLYEYAQKEKIMLVIDEYPYLAKKYQGISSLLQRDIDHKFSKTNLFLILCGSSMSFMEKQVMGHKSPLYGRRTGQIKLLPFDYRTSRTFVSKFKSVEQAVIYGMTGGIPKYLILFDDKRSLKENIIKNYFQVGSLLFEEPANLLNQELREPAVYNSVITAIATGSSKLNEIATKAHIETAQCTAYLNSLIVLGIVKREIPFMDKVTSKKSIYRLNDGMFRFWYRFVYRNLSRIQLGRGETVYQQIEPLISDFMGEVFEQICKEYLWNAKLPFEIRDVGRWWGNNPLKKSEQEIDLIATDNDDKKAIFCECKWTNEKVPESVITGLIDKSTMFHFEEKYYYIFSKSGFTESAKKKANDFVRLIEFRDA
jgi:AAA+ ATPase superfamily predicted ATPase